MWVTPMLVLFISSTESSISYQENSLESKQGIYYLFIVLIRSVWNSNTKIKRREKERKLKISMQIHINNKKSISIWRMQKKNSEMKRGISVNHSTHRIVGSSVYPRKVSIHSLSSQPTMWIVMHHTHSIRRIN